MNTNLIRPAAICGSLLLSLATSCLSAGSPSDSSTISGDLYSDETGVSSRPMAPKLTGDGVFFVVSEDPKKPLARYGDGQLSMSNSCAIKLENKLNRRIPPAYVNGRPIGFC